MKYSDPNGRVEMYQLTGNKQCKTLTVRRLIQDAATFVCNSKMTREYCINHKQTNTR